MNETRSRIRLQQKEVLELLRPGQSVELLKELHILTENATLNADSRRKLKQVDHLIQLLEPGLKAVLKKEAPVLADLGSGKSYLGFLIYDLFLKTHSEVNLWNLESRSELTEKSQKLAQRLNFSGMRFKTGAISTIDDDLPEKIHLVTALHACDQATDDALRFGLKHQADFIYLVPCCQAQLAKHLKHFNLEEDFNSWSELWREPLHRREFASHLTNVARGLKLKANGYHVTVTELVGWEHSLKNELILAEKKGGPRAEDQQRWETFLKRFPVLKDAGIAE